jgi:hypothetical protein
MGRKRPARHSDTPGPRTAGHGFTPEEKAAMWERPGS